MTKRRMLKYRGECLGNYINGGSIPSGAPCSVAQWTSNDVSLQLVAMANIAAANAGRNYSHHIHGWSVRFDSYPRQRSLARAGPSGFVHTCRRCRRPSRQMPAGLQVERPVCFGGKVGCSSHPVFRRECVAQFRSCHPCCRDRNA